MAIENEGDGYLHPPGGVHNPYPIDHPQQALIRDHDMFRKLADAWLNTNDMAVKKQAGKQIVQLLHTHSRLEESVFYPGVRQVDPGMIGRFEQEHLKADDLLATLQGMTLDEPQADRMMRDLISISQNHIQEEEHDFFPKLEQANMDLSPIGAQMQAFEANLIHMQAQVAQPARRPGS